MKLNLLLSSFILSFLFFGNKLVAQKHMKYPDTKKQLDIQDDYHGTIISDPYRWLEDDHSEETMDWVKRQNELTFSHLDQIGFRKAINSRMTELMDYEKASAPFKEGDSYYYFKNDGLQNQSILFRSATIDGEGEVFFDPNKLSEDGTSSLASFSFNKAGNLFAYLVSTGGSDWRTAYIMEVETGELLADNIDWVKFSGISWAGDGFYYSRYPEPSETGELSAQNQFHKLYYHKLGTDQSQDVLIMEDKDHPQRNFYGATSEDEDFLFISPIESTSGNSLYFKELGIEGAPVVKLVDDFENDFSVVGTVGDRMYILTNKDAPNQKLIQVNAKDHNESKWIDLIPESNDKLESIKLLGGKIFASYLNNASSLVKVYDLDGQFIQNLELPGIGTASGLRGKKDDSEGFFSFTSFINPSTIYLLDATNLTYKEYRKSKVNFDPSLYVTNQLWFNSKDGTKVPMFVTHKKGIELNGTNPTLLYGYGGFNIPLTPGFNPTRIPLLENGGVYVVVNLRGGGEFGRTWHEAGTLERKQNVFDDFQAAAEYLIAQNYTSSKYLAIEGGSNGGLLVGACMTQRPDLYAVAFPAVGVLDMLRYHKFTIGWAWATDYGLSSDPEAFKYLIKYSPLHNVKDAKYPATMVLTADHDDRVVPAHSFKFIATLQDHQQGEQPVLIRIETSAGHGAGKPTSKIIDEASDKLAFMLYYMNRGFMME